MDAVSTPDNITWEELDDVTRNHYVLVDHNNDTITGCMESLIELFHDLDGPAQSFPVDEFKEWASLYEVDENNIPV